MTVPRILWAMALAAGSVYCQETDPWHEAHPHDVPHCSPAPKDQSKSALCRCLGMVEDVKASYARRCWGGSPPSDVEMSIMNLGAQLGMMPPSVRDCMERRPDHCAIVSNSGHWRFQTGIPYDGKRECRTACKPERCGCPDSKTGCSPHKDTT